MFRVGDKFRVVRSICPVGEFAKQVGKIDTVTDVIERENRSEKYQTEIYGTNFTGANLWFESEIEKVEEEMKFKVGDKVKVINNNDLFHSDIGKIESINNCNNSICVVFSNGSCYWYLEHELKLVPFSTADLTTGMVVEYMDGSKGIVLKDTGIEYQENIALTFYPHKGSYSEIDDDFLTYDEYSDFTVKRIIKPYDVSEIFSFPESIEGEVIWERPNKEKDELNQQISKLEQELKEAKERLEKM